MYGELINKLAKKFIRVGGTDEVVAAVQSQPAYRKIMLKGLKQLRAVGRTPLTASPRTTRIGENNRGVRQLVSEGVQGTIHQAKKTGKRHVVLHREHLKDPDVSRRQLIAHEAFHAKAPKGLRGSETLAHIYGGVKGTKGSALKKMKAGAQEYNHYSATRPDRALRVPAVAGAAIGGVVNTVRAKRHNKRVDERKKEEGANFQKSWRLNQKRSLLHAGAKGAAVGAGIGALASETSRVMGRNRDQRIQEKAKKKGAK